MSVPNIQSILHNAQKKQQTSPAASTSVASGFSSSFSISQVQTHDQKLQTVCLIPTSSSVGHYQAFQQVCNSIKDDTVGSIGTYGMGGVGKTTLIKRVHNELLPTCDFHDIIWIVVSKEVDEKRIQRSIMNKLALPYDDLKTEDELAMDYIINFLPGNF